MKKLYFAPEIEIVKLTSHTILAALSRTEDEADGNAEALGREGFSPVSEDNANALWDE